MEKNQAIQDVLQLLAPFKRTTYIPVAVSEKPAYSTASKIGGYPYLRNQNDWPVCPNCNKNMQLFLQLNLNELPANKKDGIVQLFYCTNNNFECESDCEAYSPFSKSVVCRKIEITLAPVHVAPNIDELFEEKRIVSWEAKDDYPHYEEFHELGIEMDDDKYEIAQNNDQGIPLSGDKLFGWPYWVQGQEYPSDRKTKSRMGMLFQLDSEVNLPFMFGDVGVGHLTQSPDDDQELAFGWACH
jgi:uncharacterized protein YwqG